MKSTKLFAAILATAVSGGSVAGIVTEDIAGGGQALVVSGTSFTDEEASALNENTVQELWKTGSSTLVATGIGSFTGAIRVKEGVYKITEATGAGALVAKVYVTQGGVFYTSWGDVSKEVHIAGTGNGTYTALVKSGVGMKLVMDGDATISFLGNFCTLASSLDMNGYTLTQGFCGEASGGRSESVWPKSSAIANLGNVVIDGVSSKGSLTRLTFLYSSDQLQGSNHTLTIRNGLLDWYSTGKYDTNWKLVCETDVDIGCLNSATGATGFRWSGPIEIKSGKTLRLFPNKSIGAFVSGDISGAGSVSVGGTTDVADYRAYISGNNTYTGTTTINNADLYSLKASSLSVGQASKLTFDDTYKKSLILSAKSDDHADGYSAEDVKAFLDAAPNGSAYVAVDEGETFDYPYAFASSFTGYLGAWGAGLLRYTAAAPAGNVLRFRANTNVLVTAGAEAATRVNAPDNFIVARGRVTLADAGTFAVRRADGSFAITGTQAPYPELVVTGRTSFVLASDADGDRDATTLRLASNPGFGRVEICAGAVMTNSFSINYGNVNSPATGEVIQRGGMVMQTQKNNDGYFGTQNSSFSYTLEGGLLALDKYVHVANAGKTRSMSILRIAGGTLEKTGYGDLQLGWGGGTAVVYQTGGTYRQPGNNIRLNSNYYIKTAQGGFALWASEGSNSLAEAKSTVWMGENTNSVSHFALNDGAVFATSGIWRQTRQPNGYFEADQMVNNKCYVHFNGGVLRQYAGTSWPQLLGTNGVDRATGVNYSTAPDKVAVYEKGLTVDIPDGLFAYVSAALEEPQGLGVKTVTLPDEADRDGWYGGIHVQIFGEGEGATAVAQYDTVNHRLTGVKVTSAGWGYREGTTRAVVSMGGKTNMYECAVTLGESKGGGFAKTGAGELYLRGANTYTGPTKIAGGKLHCSAEGSLPAGTTLEFAGGLIDLGSNAKPTKYAVDADAAKAAGGFAYAGNWTFPAGSTLTIRNFTPPSEDEKTFKLLTVTGTLANPPTPTLEGGVQPAEPWEFKWRGKTLCCRNKRGLVFIVR